MSRRRALLALVTSCAALCCSAGESGDAHAPRLLVVGWDGATFQMIDPLLARGRLPNLARLIARGSSARLESTRVPISSAAWVGAVTGKTPGQTGVYSFFEPIEGSYDVRLISARSNQAAPLWRILAWNGMKSIVFNVPVTYPPERIESAMVAGMLAPLDSDYAYPAGLAERLRARGFVPDLGAWRENQEVTFARVESQLTLKRDILVEMLRSLDWDLALLVFKDLDVWSHHAYDADPDASIGRHYELLDAVLGDLLDAAPPDSNVIVLSDHGFEAYHRSFFVQRWLLERGFAVARASAAPAAHETASLAEQRALDHQQRLAALDLRRSAAYAGACEANYGSVRLNVVGREPQGAVPVAELDAKLDEISRALLATPLPGSQRPLVTRVFRARELYPGPFASRLPDLIFELDPSVAARPENPSVAFIEHAGIHPDHHLQGVFFAAGPAFAPRVVRGDVSILDLAPTALHLLGLPIYADMTGQLHPELLRNPTPPRILRDLNEDPRARNAPPPSFVEASQNSDTEIESRLRALGYTE